MSLFRYLNHKVFKQIYDLSEFYKMFGFSVFSWFKYGTRGLNFDSQV